MLELFYATEAEVPAELKHLYKQEGGGWHLNIKGGAVPRAKLDEFRDNNTNLVKKVGDLEAKLTAFDGIDPVKAKELAGRAADIESGQLIKAGELEKAKEGIKTALESEHARQLKVVQDENASLKNQLATTNGALSKQVIDNNLMVEARKLGLQDGAENLLLPFAGQSWKLENGQPVAYDAQGRKEYGRTGDPIGMVEWLEKFSQGNGAPLFKKNNGSGAAPDGQGGGGGTGTSGGSAPTNVQSGQGLFGGQKNPWSKQYWNLTEQSKIAVKDRPLAERMAAAEGKKVPPRVQ